MSSEITLIADTISSEMSALTLKISALLPVEEVDLSAEQTMLIAVEQKLGKKTLLCTHCGKREQPLTKFIKQIAESYKNGELSKIPKICDNQMEWNLFNNPVTNTKVSINRYKTKLSTVTDEAEKTKIIAKLGELELKLAVAEKARDTWRSQA
jgi:hypothetical protein